MRDSMRQCDFLESLFGQCEFLELSTVSIQRIDCDTVNFPWVSVVSPMLAILVSYGQTVTDNRDHWSGSYMYNI